MLACVVMAYGLVGAALTGAPTHLHCNRQSHRERRYGNVHGRGHRYRYRDACRERDKSADRVGNKPRHRWYSSNTFYLTQRLSWRVQGSGGGV